MKHTKVFLDANILIKAGKPPGGPILIRLKDLVNAGFITVLTTDLTWREVAKRHANNDYDVIKDVGQTHFRNIVKAVLGTELPETSKAELKAKLNEAYELSTEAMFKELNCKMLAIDNVKPSIVFSSYTADEGFFTQKGKKNQFPDAFIFECLKTEASKKEPIIIVSNDGDFDKPVEDIPYISLVKSFPELFETLGLKIDAPPDVGNFLEDHEEELVEALYDELDRCGGIVGDIEDSEIEETNIIEVEAMGLTSFGSATKGGPILVVGSLSVGAEIRYVHPEDWVYDSEDKRFIPIGYLEDWANVNFSVDMSMSLAVNEKDNPEYIEELNFRSDGPQYVELDPYGSY